MTSARVNGPSEQESVPHPVTALVLAGARPGRDPVAEVVGVSIKVLAPVGGMPMVARVLLCYRLLTITGTFSRGHLSRFLHSALKHL